MKARITIEIEVSDECDLIDIAEIARHASALLLLRPDRRLENARPIGAEHVRESGDER
jgi:hypothetical protein